ncbi:polyadenylate-binding protein RBP47-like [Iris pallida]|uniref:Polyadenylate-binding protein RBP47-like n=1 Tax=Iris pallida TaxID=29817 RepID=A0AAX6FIG1_IRIPA|nr:polyadenylate-binding protein RBP47-like [Iris pallida]KAJ6823562.1 polyadenylate-binding protein RBP47-like [Iris pallida]
MMMMPSPQHHQHQHQQQQWVPMQYPPMMHAPPPQFAPPPQHFIAYQTPPPAAPQQAMPMPPPKSQSQNQQGGGGGEENRTIWAGDLHYWMDENYLHSCFAHAAEVISIKVIRNKHTGQSEGYGFVEFSTHAQAENVLQNFTCHVMPNTDQPFRLNWASFSMGDRRADVASDHSIFVGDLAPDVTDTLLHETFAGKYPSVKGAKVVMDSITGRSKGYGFIRFGNDDEKAQAMTEMNGVYCSSRPMRIGAATPKKSSGGFGSSGAFAQGLQSDGESTNTTVFVGGLDPNVSEDELKQAFAQYGEIASVKIPLGKQCGFVQFVNRSNAEDALLGLNGKAIGKQTVRLSWGRSPANKQLRGDQVNQWNSGAYYGGQVYGGYGYTAVPLQSPNMYAAAAYGAYPLYGSQQVS